MKKQCWPNLFVMLALSIPAMAATAADSPRYVAVAPHGRYVVLFELQPARTGGIVGYLRRDDAWTNAPFNLGPGAMPEAQYNASTDSAFMTTFNFGTPGNASGFGPPQPGVANVIPSAAAINSDTAYLAFAKMGGQLALGVIDKETSAEYNLPATMNASAPNVSAAVTPEGAVLVAYQNPNGQIQIDAWWVSTDPQNPGVSGSTLATLAPPQGANGWNGNVSVAVRAAAGTAQPSDQVFVALRVGGAISLGSGVIPALTPGSSQALNVQWQAITPPNGTLDGAMSLANVNIGSDTRVQLAYLDASSRPRIAQVDGASLTPKGPLQAVTALTTPIIAYTMGNVATSQRSDRDGSTEYRVPVYQSVFYQAAGDDPRANPGGAILAYGAALKSPLKQFTAAKDVLVGIIDGPPPVPVENIVSAKPHTSTIDIGSTTYGDATTNASDSSMSMKGGVVVKQSAEAEGFSAEMSAKLGMGTETSTSTETKLSSVFSADGEARLDTTTNHWEVEPLGTAFLLSTQVAGYNYYFLDDAGNQVSGAPARTDVWLTPARIVSKSFQFSTDPNLNVIPGELPTYFKTTQQMRDMSSNAVTLGTTNGLNALNFAWSMSGHYQQESETAKTTKTKKTSEVDVEALVGTSASFPGVGEWKAQVGGYFNLDTEDTQSTTNQQKYATEAKCPVPQLNDPGTYSDYQYFTFVLTKSDPNDLIAILRKNPTPMNQELLQRLVDPGNPQSQPIGQPWKMTYAILSDSSAVGFTRVPGTTPAGAKASIPPSLAAKGVTSHADLGALHAIVRAPQPMQLRPTAPDPKLAQLHAVAQQLTPQEKNDLLTYVKQSRDEAVAEFQHRHPNWRPQQMFRPFVPPPSRRPAPKVRAQVQVGSLIHDGRLRHATLVKRETAKATTISSSGGR